MADREDEVRNARQDMSNVLRKIREAKSGKHNFGLEAQYGQAYQWLVRLGEVPQLRLKYRR
jgi:hypothetical protein